MRPIGIACALVLLLTLSLPTLWAPAGSTAMLEPLVVGWQRIFKLDWQVSERRSRSVVNGYLVNDSPYLLWRVQLLVDALDSSGEIVGQQVSWAGPGAMEPFTRMYFEVPVPRQTSSTYRVRVFAFDRLESPSNPRSGR